VPSTPSTEDRAAHDDGAVLLVEPSAALRREHAPDRALTLARRYLAEHPDGELAEEALALEVQAAQETEKDAATLARAYLARYPNGRFVEQARAVLRGR
jgi:hypothetical protein